MTARTTSEISDRTATVKRWWLSGWALALAVLIVGVSMAVASGMQTRSDADRRAGEAMDRRTELIASEVRTEVNRYIDTMRSLTDAMSNYPDLTANQFERATSSLRDIDLAGAVAMTWVAAAPANQTDSVERHWRERGFRDEFQPFGGAPKHYFTIFTTPLNNNPSATLGIDSARAEQPLQALRESERTGQVTVSETYELIRDQALPSDQRQLSFVLVAPVKFANAGASTAGESSDVSGWLVMALRGEDFVSSALRGTSQGTADVVLTTWSSNVGVVDVARIDASIPGDRDLFRSFTVPVAQQMWGVEVQSVSEVMSGDSSAPFWTTVAGVLISLLLAALVYVLANARARAERQVRVATEELRESEQQVRQQAALLGSVVSSLSEGVGVVDKEGNFLVHNEAAKKMLLVDDSDKGPDDWQEHYGLYLPDGVTPFPTDQMPLVRALAGEIVEHVEMVVRASIHQVPRTLSVSARPLGMSAGQAGAVAVFRDVTAERQYTAKLEELNSDLINANRFSQGLFESVPDATLLVDADGTIVQANMQATLLFGYDIQELTGMTVDTLVPSDVRHMHKPLRESYERIPRTRPMGAGLDLFGERKDGAKVPLDILLSPMATDQGVYTIAAVRDVTERRQAEERLRIARQEAERASSAKSDFLSRMSHELRTPLAAVLGFAAVLEEEGDELATRHLDMVRRIERAGRHLLSLINDVLDISRIESGHMGLSLEPVNVAEVVRHGFDLTGQVHSQRNVGTVLDIDPQMHVHADRSRFQQVIVNLLSNAGKYNRRGGSIKVTAARNGDFIDVLVTDTGTGIDRERMSDLFMPFSRLGAERTKIEGTGLGLALSKALAEQMNGRLEVANTSSEGTTFVFTLPAASREELTTIEIASTSEVHQSLRELTAEIVYIEDNPDNISVFTESLARFPDLHVHAASDGSTGIEMVRAVKPDLVFLDLHLPDMDGRQVLAELRSFEEHKSVPIIILTADAIGSSKAEMLQRQASGYLTKPFVVADLLVAIRQYLLVDA